MRDLDAHDGERVEARRLRDGRGRIEARLRRAPVEVQRAVTRRAVRDQPTRLIDFTKSPFVAAFFALERATGNAAVWAINTLALFDGVPLRGKRARYGQRAAVDPRDPEKFERYFLRNDVPFVWSGEPYKMNRRLIAQGGTFVIPGVLDLSVEDILGTYPRPEELILKLVLPAKKLRASAMAALYRMNITHATLFPDLDGLARSLAYELETSWRGTTKQPGFYNL